MNGQKSTLSLSLCTGPTIPPPDCHNGGLCSCLFSIREQKHDLETHFFLATLSKLKAEIYSFQLNSFPVGPFQCNTLGLKNDSMMKLNNIFLFFLN